MNTFLWILQVFFGIYFFLVGVMHFVIPPGLPAQMSWMYDLDPTLHWISGTAEILGGLGLILPAVTRIKTWLTPLAALGLSTVMVLAMVYHLGRGEFLNIVLNLFAAAIMAFLAYGRWKLLPLPDRTA